MRNLSLVLISIGLGYFIVKDLNLAIEYFNNFSQIPVYSSVLNGFIELAKTLILSMFLITVWLVNISLYLGGILEEKAHTLGQSSEGATS